MAGLGPGLLGYACEFDSAYYTDDLFTAIGLQLPARLQEAVLKRKAEFFAGRFCAATLLGNVGLPTQVQSAANRAPVWPVGASGAISHSRNQAVCVIATDPALLVGVDVEHYLSPARCEALGGSIISAQEKMQLPANLPYYQALTLCFSAKESAYKAIYPLVGRYVDFLHASIQIDPNLQQFSISLMPELAEIIAVDIRGYYQLFDDYLLTYISTLRPSVFLPTPTQPGDNNYDIAP